ncbi:MAG: flagellar hook capping FlgD N-terminal domain-containing protein [Gammaproteobacteria bacterium]
MAVPISPSQTRNEHVSRGTERQTAAKGEKSLKDDFMKVFLTQMLKQNPMKPNDSSMMMQQMGQLTALQSTEDLQKSVKLLTENLGKSQLLAAAQLVGRQVQVPYKMSSLIKSGEGDKASAKLSGSVIVPKDATNVVVTIKNPQGDVVAKIDKGNSGRGILDFDWDGMIGEGDKRALGTDDFYHLSASGTIDGVSAELITNGAFTVTSVTMDPGDKSTILNLDGIGGRGMNELIKIT